MPPSSPDRLAVVQPLPGIGDMVWHLAHVRAIAAHWGTPVTLIAKPRSAADQIFAAEPAVADVLWMDRNPAEGSGSHDGASGLLRLIGELHARRFRRAVLLHHSRTLAFVLLAAGIPERHGYGIGMQRLFLNRAAQLPAAAARLHPHAQATAWLAAAGIPLTDPEPRLPVVAAARAAVSGRLPPGHGPLVVLGIGSSEATKQWGAAAFAELAAGLAALGWRRFMLAGGVAETSLADEVQARLGSPAAAVPAIAWNLSELAALCAGAAFYVGNDTGAMNLAAAVGIRSYALFGATAPIRHSNRIVPILPPDGEPDPRDGMRRITPGMVLATIRRVEAAALPS